MTEFNPFSAGEQAPEYAPEVAEETEGSRKTVVLVGALAAVAVGAGAFLFLGGSGEEEDDFVVKRAPRPAAAAAASPAPAAKLPTATKVTLGRNPFRALYVAPVTAAGGTTTGTSTTGTGTGTGTTPGATTGSTGGTTTPVVIVDSGSGSSTGGTSKPAQPAPAPAAQSTVALKKVAAGKGGSNPTGTFVYDGKEVTGAPGDVMAGKLLVISLQQDATGSWFANLQLGDGSPFEVHERQTVVVQ